MDDDTARAYRPYMLNAAYSLDPAIQVMLAEIAAAVQKAYASVADVPLSGKTYTAQTIAGPVTVVFPSRGGT